MIPKTVKNPPKKQFRPPISLQGQPIKIGKVPKRIEISPTVSKNLDLT